MDSTNVAVVVAIDFGTTYSGYAFSTKENFKRNPPQIYGNERWLGGDALSTEKTSTTILFNPNGEYKYFGYKAEDEYEKLVLNEEHKNWYYFRRFKMQLLKPNHRKLRRGMTICDETGKAMPAIKIFSESIRYLVNHFHEYVKKTGARYQENEIKWMITVPAIWDDGAKQFMREAANLAGVPNDQLELALEPEAGAICSIKEISLKKEGLTQIPRSPGSTFMIVDCGGGTVDIFVGSVTGDGTFKEICAPTGGPWGGTTVDAAFVSFLEEIFGKAIIQKFENYYKSEHIELMRSFEVLKRKFKDDSMVIKISIDLISLIKQEGDGQSLEETISLSKYRDTVSFHAKTRRLIIESSVIREFFAEARKNIVEQIKDLLAKYPSIQYILTVGGFSDSGEILQAIRQADRSKTVIRPEEASFAIVKGAVLYGHDKFAIISRISPFTYGINCTIPFDDTVHPALMKTIKGDCILFQEAFQVFLRSGDVMVPGQTKVIHEFRPANPDDIVATVEVYRSTNPDPCCIYNRKCTRVGVIKLYFEKHNEIYVRRGITNNRIVEVIMHFGHTELTVEARESGTNNKVESEYDFLNGKHELKLRHLCACGTVNTELI